MNGISFVTCSRPGGAPESQGQERERGGVHQLRERGHARGEDPGGRGGGGAQNRDLHRDQPGDAVQLGERRFSSDNKLCLFPTRQAYCWKWPLFSTSACLIPLNLDIRLCVFVTNIVLVK